MKRTQELRANRRQRHFERLARARSWVEDARTQASRCARFQAANTQEQRDAAAHLERIEANTHLYSGNHRQS